MPISVAIKDKNKWWGCGAIGILAVLCWWKCKILWPLCKSFGFLKVNTELSYNPATSLLYTPKIWKQRPERIRTQNIHSSIIHNSKKMSINLGVHQQMNKMFIYIKWNIIQPKKRNEILIPVTTWMTLQNIIYEIKQTQRTNILWFHLHKVTKIVKFKERK